MFGTNKLAVEQYYSETGDLSTPASAAGYSANLYGSHLDMTVAVSGATVSTAGFIATIFEAGGAAGDDIDPTANDDEMTFTAAATPAGNLEWSVACTDGIATNRCPER
ncbi:hypothetical protein [Marinobacterium ramblicola]|uniref:hypothetical protein n=1 Tax=Marinobacterium ramblicola TaxID=2849041 RepID=UPI003CCEB27E